MIVRDRPEAFDGHWKLVLFDVDAAGGLTSGLTEPITHGDVHLYYVQRHKELLRLKAEVEAGKVSPLALFLDLNRMNVVDLAARSGVSRGTVQKHLTPKGFDGASVSQLRAYARVFDIAVADFFSFLHLPDGLEASSRDFQGHLVQVTDVKAKGA